MGGTLVVKKYTKYDMIGLVANFLSLRGQIFSLSNGAVNWGIKSRVGFGDGVANNLAWVIGMIYATSILCL